MSLHRKLGRSLRGRDDYINFWRARKIEFEIRKFSAEPEGVMVRWPGSQLPTGGQQSDLSPFLALATQSCVPCHCHSPAQMLSQVSPGTGDACVSEENLVATWHSLVEKVETLESNQSESKGLCCCLLALWCQACYFKSLGLSFSSLNMMVRLAPSGFCEDAFIQQIFIEHLLCAGHCSNMLLYVRKQNKDPWLWALTFLEVKGWMEGKRWLTMT